VFQNQDANGLYRRVFFTASCNTIRNMLDSTPLTQLITPVGAVYETACP
jgi:hypothetical protein